MKILSEPPYFYDSYSCHPTSRPQSHEQFVAEARAISVTESARAVASVSDAVDAIDGRVLGAEMKMSEIADALNSQQMVSAALGELVASFQVWSSAKRIFVEQLFECLNGNAALSLFHFCL